jgi:hypothetical protein
MYRTSTMRDGHGLETIGGQREVATRRWHGRVATSYYLAIT